VDEEISLAEALGALVTLAKIAPRLAALIEQPVRAERQEWYSVKQAAVYCGVTEDAIRSAIKSDALRAHRRGERSLALHRDDLDRWMGAA
jgi:excisionase family DNA binding protein